MTDSADHGDDAASSAALAYARTGSLEDLGRALSACADSAYTQARRLLRSPEDAEDAVQNAFMALIREARRYDGRAAFGAWVAQRVHTACIDLMRRQKPRSPLTSEVAAPELAAEHPLTDQVAAAVRSLAERYRSVVDLHYFAGLSQEDTATALGLTANAVAVRLHRARELLRRYLAGAAISEAMLVARLSAVPRFSAPEGLLTVIHGPVLPVGAASASVAPLIRSWTFLMRHPILSTLSLAGTVALTITLLSGGETPPKAPTTWSKEAQELLTWLPEQPAFAVGADLAQLRKLAAVTRPTSLLAEPGGAALQKVLVNRLLDAKAPTFGLRFWDSRILAPLLRGLADPQAAGLALGWSPRPALRDEQLVIPLVRPPEHGFSQRLACLFDLGPAVVTDWRQRFIDGSGQGSGPLQELLGTQGRQRLGAFEGRTTGGGTFVGLSDRCFVLAAERLLRRRLAGKPPVLPDRWLATPAWTEGDASAFFATWQGLVQRHGDRIQADRLFGSGWRTAKPSWCASLSAKDDLWQVDSRLTLWKDAPTLATLFLAAAPDASGDQAFLAAIRPLRLEPVAAPLLDLPSDTLAWAGLGLAEVDPRILANFIPLLNQFAERDVLLGAWSGDVVVAVRPGPLLPSALVRLGLRPGAHPRKGLDALMQWLKAVPAEGGAAQAAWTLAIDLPLVPSLTISLFPDRLEILTTEAQPVLATRQRTCPGLSLWVDLPTVVNTYRSLVPSLLGAEVAAVLPRPVVVQQHLAPWSLDLTPAQDGWNLRERGAALTLALPALLALVLEGDDVDIEAGYAGAKDQEQATLKAEKIWDQHRERCEAMRKIAEAWDRVDQEKNPPLPKTWPELLALLGQKADTLAPYFGGRVPTAEDLADLGRYGMPLAETTIYGAPDRSPRGMLKIPGKVQVDPAQLPEEIRRELASGSTVWVHDPFTSDSFCLPLDGQWSLLWCPHWRWRSGNGPYQSLLALVPKPVDQVVPSGVQ